MVKRQREENLSSSSDGLLTEANDAKYTHIDFENPASSGGQLIHCSLPPHQPQSFSTFGEFDIHYQKTHVNRCSECHKNLPTGHFLNLHIEENHDPLNRARRARGQRTYRCFVEDCDRVCSTQFKRRMHMTDKHFFPRDYDFFIVNDGIDWRRSMLRTSYHQNRRNSAAIKSQTSDEKDTEKTVAEGGKEKPAKDGSSGEAEVVESPTRNAPTRRRSNMDSSSFASSPSEDNVLTPESTTAGEDNDVDDVTRSMSALRFVPPSVRFGRRKGRAGFATS